MIAKKQFKDTVDYLCEQYFPLDKDTGIQSFEWSFTTEQGEKDFYSSLGMSEDKIPKESLTSTIVINSPSRYLAKTKDEEVYGYSYCFPLSELGTISDKEIVLDYRIFPAIEKACKTILEAQNK